MSLCRLRVFTAVKIIFKMLHLYIGDGKGKTTAALGLALRACGAEKKVYFAQFLKDSKFPCGEEAPLKKIGVKFERFRHQIHPLFDKAGEKSSSTKKSIDSALSGIEKVIAGRKFNVIVLDEILNAWEAGLVDEKRLIGIVVAAQSLELVLTGRNTPKSIATLAAYVSVVKKVKHPFDKKIVARKGIEY